MRRRQQQKQNNKKEQKIVHKGIYISNQRRKGPGGRIKCDTFQCKIQVADFNPAIHQSQIEWVQIRRYVRGDKKDFNNKDKRQGKDFKKDDKTSKNSGNNYKLKNQNKNGSKQDKVGQNKTINESKPVQSTGSVNLVKKFKQKIAEQAKSLLKQTLNQKLQQIKIETQSVTTVEQLISPESKKQQVRQIEHNQQRNQDQIQTESDNDQNDERGHQNQQFDHESKEKKIVIKQKKAALLVIAKSKEDLNGAAQQAKVDSKKPEQQKKQIQEVIVARIIKETKIVYTQKRFVAILTCEKKNNNKSTFVEKDIKPIDKIIQDYYLDVTPIHSRLPKMQFDNMVKGNINVLTDYIEKSHPEKGKDLTKKKLNQILDVIQSIYVVASFGLWDNRRPYANIHQVIGKTMTIDGQCNCFLFEHHLNDFQYDQIENSKENQKKMELSPSSLHKPFNKMVFTIDPATSVDLDDALSIQKVQENIYEIGIHISDVSEYLKFIQRSELIKRTTSVYLPHKVFHMLTTDIMKISSLNPNVQRLSFSIYVRMNQKGELMGESRLQKNIIKSRFKLSYQTVQDIITAKINFQGFLKKHPDTLLQQFQKLVDKLQDLTRIGLAHRQKRIKFEVFQNREIHFELDSQRWPIQISVQSRFTSKKIVEEYMIIGNVQAAKHLIKHFKDNALIIYHPKPSDLAVKSFNETFKFLNMKFQFEDIQQVQQKFMQIQKDKSISEEVKQFMYYKGRRVQQTAGYKFYHQAVQEIMLKSDNKDQKLIRNVHFALGQDFYTHFTSPMRRMADILVHQTLNSIMYNTVPNKISDQEIQKINTGRKHTKRLKRDLTQMYMCLMIHKTGKRIQEDGIITSFGLKSVSIYIPYFDMMKQIIWKDQLDIYRVNKNRQNQDILDICIYYDRRSPSGDIYWKAKKYQKVKLIIDCTKRPPLRLAISLQVIGTKGQKQLIEAYFPDA